MEGDEQRPMKRSESLAVENAKRIAAQLRGERNDAVALAQIRREQAERAIALCIRLLDGGDPGGVRAELDALVSDIKTNR